MKKSILFFATILLTVNLSFSQLSAESLIDNAMSMVQKGDNQDMARALDLVSNGLKSEVSAGGGIFKDKLLSQLGGLSSIATALKGGASDKTALQKTLGILKTLFAAQSLSNMLKGGNLLGNAAKVASTIGLVKGGLSLLGSGSKVDQIGSILDKVTGKSAKLDKTGFFAKFAQKALKKKLGGALDMVNGLI
jgi:hypothetical protein